VLEVSEVVGGDGPIRVERLMAVGADEELDGYGGTAACHDEEKLQVLECGGGKPWERGVRSWVLSMELDVVEEVPQTDDKETNAWCNMSCQAPHGFLQSDLLLMVWLFCP
jgi:hypothetical protein